MFYAVKRPAVLLPAVCLAVGFLLGLVFPFSWTESPAPPAAPASGTANVPNTVQAGAEPGASAGNAAAPLDAQDNLSLLKAACAVNQALKEKNYAALAARVHPQKGVTFTPYSCVDFETDLTFTSGQLKNLAQDGTVYAWGFVDGRGSLIEMTIEQYIDRYVFNADYAMAPQVGIDQIIMSGNALENISEAYPGCRFVDFCCPGGGDGMDWNSLKLVFEPGESGWLLVGIVHGEWTV